MDSLLYSTWLEHLGMALVHSIWQGLLVLAVTARVLRVFRNSSPERRHLICLFALALLALMPLATVAWLGRNAAETDTASRIPLQQGVEIGHSSGDQERILLAEPIDPPTASQSDSTAGHSVSPQHHSPTWPALLSVVWGLGVLILSGRLLLGCRWLVQLRKNSFPWTGEPSLPPLLARMGLRSARVFTTASLAVPVVAGWLRPVILMPVRLLTRLDAEAVTTLLLHEFAHLKRRDPLFNLGITVVETVLFFNPSVHVLARRARLESELACDDFVLSLNPNRMAYAKVLADLETWRPEGLAMAASGSHHLLLRVRRILGMPEVPNRRAFIPAWRPGMAALTAVSLFLWMSIMTVPPLARAMSAEERMAAIAAVQAVFPEVSDADWTARGRLVDEQGQVLPPQAFTVSSSSYGTSDFVTETSPERFVIRGRGDSAHASVWLDGYAPVTVRVKAPVPPSQEATFEVKLAKGFPAELQIVDEDGDPVPNASISMDSSGSERNALNMRTPPSSAKDGRVSIGNITEGIPINIEVFARGYEWTVFAGIRFTRDTPTILTLTRATPVEVSVVDDATGRPIPNAGALCGGRSYGVGFTSGYNQDQLRPLAARTSGADGKLTLDVCHATSEYGVIIRAPEYAPASVLIPKGITNRQSIFEVRLKQGLKLEGTIHDPLGLLAKLPKGFMITYTSTLTPPHQERRGRTVGLRSILSLDRQRAAQPFNLERLPAGPLELNLGRSKEWKAELKESVSNLNLYVTHSGISEQPPGKLAAEFQQNRKVIFRLIPPPGSPAAQGNLTVYVHARPRSVPVINNTVELDVPLGVQVYTQGHGLTGYSLAKRFPLFVADAGVKPLEFELPLVASGVISGKVESSRPLGSLTSAVLRTHKPDAQQPALDPDTRFIKESQTFYIANIPLGDEYRVVFSSGKTYFETPVTTLDAEHPMREFTLKVEPSPIMSVRVLEPDGSPCSNKALYISYESLHFGGSGSGQFTDGEGRFTLEGINFDAPGKYYIQIPAEPGFQALKALLSRDTLSPVFHRQTGN